MPEESTAERLRAELEELRRRAALLEVDRLRACPTLIDVAQRLRRREPEDATDGILDAKSVLEEAIKELQGESLRIVAAAFGLGVHSHYPTLDERLGNVAEGLGVDLKTIRRREKRLIGTVAYSIAERDEAQRLREAHGRLERRHAVRTSLAIDWLDRFRHYYRMWTDLSGLRNDFSAFALRREEHPEHDAVEVYAPSSIHYFVLYLSHLKLFEEVEGGLWLLSSPDREVKVSEAAYRVTWHMPADDLEQSWLRMELQSVPQQEKAAYLERLTSQARGRAFIDRWAAWMRLCVCTADQPRPECELHQVIELCDYFLTSIDDEWNRIAPWYRLPPKTTGVGAASPETLFRKYDYTLRKLELDESGRADDSDS